jgi:hypothetical protein
MCDRMLNACARHTAVRGSGCLQLVSSLSQVRAHPCAQRQTLHAKSILGRHPMVDTPNTFRLNAHLWNASRHDRQKATHDDLMHARPGCAYTSLVGLARKAELSALNYMSRLQHVHCWAPSRGSQRTNCCSALRCIGRTHMASARKHVTIHAKGSATSSPLNRFDGLCMSRNLWSSAGMQEAMVHAPRCVYVAQ